MTLAALGLTLLLLVVLPGVAGGALLASVSADPGRPGVLLSRVLVCALTPWLLLAGVLARFSVVTATGAWTACGVLGLGAVVALSLPRTRDALRAGIDDLRHLGVVAALTALVWLPAAALLVRTSWGPLESTPWYYWGLARQVAEVGAVPATSVEFGTTAPFLDDYHLFTTGTAMLLAQHPDASVRVLQAVTLLAVLATACSAVLLAGQLGAGRLTSLATVPVTVATGIGAARLSSYRPEGFALALSLLLVALGVEWMRSGDRGALAAALVVGPVLTQVHGIAVISAVVLTGAAAVALLSRRGLRVHLRRCVLLAGGVAVAVVLVGAAFGGASGTVHAGNLPDRGGLADPTWRFYKAARGEEPTYPPDNLEILDYSLLALYERTWWWVVPALVVALLLLVAAVLVRRRGARSASGTTGGATAVTTGGFGAGRVLVFGVVALVGYVVVGSVFALGWDSYVPRRTGTQRLAMEASLLVGPIVAAGLATARSSRHRPVWWRRPGILQGATLLLLVGGGTLATAELASYDATYRSSESATRRLAGLGLSSDDIVLTNGYLEGYVDQVTGAQGLVEGRAPYTFPDLMTRGMTLLEGAADFYRRPGRNWDLLRENQVTYVIRSGTPSPLGTRNIFHSPAPLRRLESCAGLESVLRQPALRVYRVLPGATGCS